MPHKNSDEGSTTIANERHDTSQNKSDEGITSITQDFEEVKEIEIKNNSTTNYSNSDDLFENNSSQEHQCSRKSVVTESRSTS